MFKIIKNSEITSDLAYSANLFLLRNCNRNQIETNGFDTMLARIKEYLEKCAKDFKNESKESLDKIREDRDLKFGTKVMNRQIYATDIDNSGIRTTLNVILEPLSCLRQRLIKYQIFTINLKVICTQFLRKATLVKKSLSWTFSRVLHLTQKLVKI